MYNIHDKILGLDVETSLATMRADLIDLIAPNEDMDEIIDDLVYAVKNNDWTSVQNLADYLDIEVQ